VLREFQGPVGRLEAILDEPPTHRGVSEAGLFHEGARTGIRAAVVLAHPHPQFGGTMHTKAVYHTAKALARIGCAVLRFNFRGAGQSEGVFDDGMGERDDVRAALDLMHGRFPDRPLWAGGMSFGAWVAMSVGAQHPSVSLLLGISTPFSTYDFEDVARSPKQKFFIHGEQDELCPLRRAREFYARADEPKELVVIDAADHLFDGRVGEVADAVEDLLGDWTS